MAIDEKEKLRGFVLTVLDFVKVPLFDSAKEPLRNCNNLRELRAAAADMVEMCQDITGEQLADLDSLLNEKGFPSLSEMRDRGLRRLREILSKERIRSDDDWRFVESYLSDVESDVLSGKERDAADRMLAEYEPT